MEVQYTFCTTSQYCNAVEVGTRVVKFLLAFAVIVVMNGNIEWLRLFGETLQARRNEPNAVLQLVTFKMRVQLYAHFFGLGKLLLRFAYEWVSSRLYIQQCSL